MEYRFLGKSGLKVPVLSFGTATFGGEGDFFKAWGNTQVDDAKKLVSICMDAGVNLFDTADMYSNGKSEEVLGRAIEGFSRDQLILSTKSTFTFGEGPNNQGSSRLIIKLKTLFCQSEGIYPIFSVSRFFQNDKNNGVI